MDAQTLGRGPPAGALEPQVGDGEAPVEQGVWVPFAAGIVWGQSAKLETHRGGAT